MNIGVIGIGGVGGYFGGKLTRLINSKSNGDYKIYFVARSKHLEEIKKNGLILSMQEEGEITCVPTMATDNIEELPELDLILICVKSYDLNNVLDSLKSKGNQGTIIIPLLNGVDIYERIRNKISEGYVFPACAYVGTHVERYGKVTQRGGSCTILLGRDPLYKDYINKDIFEIFKKANIKYEWNDNSLPKIWEKFTFIAAFGLISASENKTIGEIMESDELGENLKSVMREIAAIAEKKSVTLPVDIVENSFEIGNNFPYNTKTSFQRDFENMEKDDERDLFGNTIVRMGKETGVETSVTEKITLKLEKIKKTRGEN